MNSTTRGQSNWRRAGVGLALAVALGLPTLQSPAQSDSTVEQVLSRPQPLADREKLAYAQETVKEIQGAIAQVKKEAEEARKAKDILKLNCLNEKLTDLNALAKVTETALAQLDGAIAKAQDDRTDHEFEKIVIARKRAQDLLREAKACTGEGIITTAEGMTSVTTSSDITGSDAPDVADPSDPGVEPPAPVDPEPEDTPFPGSQSRPQ